MRAFLNPVLLDPPTALIAALTPAAVEAGILDPDFAKLADLSLMSIDSAGKVSRIEGTIAVLRRDKPAWFRPQSTSSTFTAPKLKTPNGRGVLDLGNVASRGGA